jgi:hypothetical protein
MRREPAADERGAESAAKSEESEYTVTTNKTVTGGVNKRGRPKGSTGTPSRTKNPANQPRLAPGQRIGAPTPGARQHQAPHRTTDWRPSFLDHLSQYGNVGAACKHAVISRSQVYALRKADAVFAAAWNEALELACDAIEAEARRRAESGTEEAVYWRGKRVATELRYSDSLLMFLLRAHRPEKFGDKFKVHTPTVDAAIEQFLRERDLAKPASGTTIGTPAPVYEYSSAAESRSDGHGMFPDHSGDDKGRGRFGRGAW